MVTLPPLVGIKHSAKKQQKTNKMQTPTASPAFRFPSAYVLILGSSHRFIRGWLTLLCPLFCFSVLLSLMSFRPPLRGSGTECSMAKWVACSSFQFSSSLVVSFCVSHFPCSSSEPLLPSEHWKEGEICSSGNDTHIFTFYSIFFMFFCVTYFKFKCLACRDFHCTRRLNLAG